MEEGQKRFIPQIKEVGQAMQVRQTSEFLQNPELAPQRQEEISHLLGFLGSLADQIGVQGFILQKLQKEIADLEKKAKK